MLHWKIFGVCGFLAAFVGAVGRQESESLIEKLKQDDVKNSISWGLLDATANAGDLFEYHLPRTTYGDTKYTVSETGTDRLPDWLSFDAKQNLLEGVPGSVDRGRMYYIEVTATNFLKKRQTLSKDIFIISVQKANDVSTGISAKPLRDLHGNVTSPIVCGPGTAVTMATIIVDADFEAKSGSARAKLLRDFGRHIGLPATSLRLMTSGGVDDQQLDSIALVAGPGNVVAPKYRKSVLIQWAVGGGSVTTRNMKILEFLEMTALNGSLAQEIGNGIVSWHVTNSRTFGAMRRKRLVPHPTATPLPTLKPPIGQPTATMMVLPTDGAPETRIIPSFSSPSVSVTSERPHRSKTKIRHPSKTKHLKHTPSMSTKVSVEGELSVGSSLVLGPTPSAVLPVIPTRSDVTEYPKHPLTPKAPDALEPSLVFPVASVAATPTRPLVTFTRLSVTPSRPQITASWPLVGKTLDIPKEGGKTPALPATVQIPTDNYNYPPLRKNNIEPLSVSVGEVFKYTIPNDTFFDHEDGPTPNLELFFLTMDGLSLAPNSWIKFNETQQTLYGMPLEEHAGRQDYILAAKDSGGKLTRYNLEIVTHRRFLERKVNHEVKVRLNTDYQQFMMNVDQRIDVASKIARAQGDSEVLKMAVTRILEGSVEFFWANLSLASDEPCPVDSLQRLTEQMILEDGTLSPDFVKSLEPYEVEYVEFAPKGTCTSRMSARRGRRPHDIVETPDIGESASETNPGVAKSNDGLLMTTIVPTLLVIVIIAFALVLFCAIWTRKKKGDGGCETNHTARKGVPVIFADELEEKPTLPSKPLILTDEKPPVAPPDYDQATASNSPSTPRSCCNDPLIPGHENSGPLQRSHHPTNPTHTASYTAGHRGTHKRTGSSSRAQLQQKTSRNPPPYAPS